MVDSPFSPLLPSPSLSTQPSRSEEAFTASESQFLSFVVSFIVNFLVSVFVSFECDWAEAVRSFSTSAYFLSLPVCKSQESAKILIFLIALYLLISFLFKADSSFLFMAQTDVVVAIEKGI